LRPGPARLLFPALRWDEQSGFDALHMQIESALRRGVGGFIVFGGEADAVRQLTRRTQERCDYPLLFGSDLERGAGQQFRGATQLPPLAAIGALDDLQLTRSAAQLTAREARALGINWIFAPDADIDIEPANPIIGTRAFGATPALVARHVAEWTAGCHDSNALACAKHFPGHGRTIEDSHATLPRVRAGRAALEDDLEPFRAAIDAGVDAIMTAHVVYDALDESTAATLSSRIIVELLRGTLRYDGVVVTDGLGMQGILDACDGSEPGAALAALNAGCDALLYPTDFTVVADALDAEYRRSLPERRVTEALERLTAAANRTFTEPAGSWGTSADQQWSMDVAMRAIVPARDVIRLPRQFDVLTVDDDEGGPFAPPSREPFINALRDHGLDPEPVTSADAERPLVVAVYADIRAWKGVPGISPDARNWIGDALQTRSDAVIVLFGHPRLAESLPGRHLVASWGGEEIMQRAAAGWLALANKQG
jgi:beta-N-acetylhexosaminidase